MPLTGDSERAIEFGLVLAEHFSAHLTLLHVYHESYAVEYMRGPDASEEVRKERIHSVNALKLFAKNVKERYADCDTEFRDGEPCEEIVSTAKEQHIDLIVISTHHYNWLSRLAYGCDAARILRRAPCPILVVKVNEEGVRISQGRGSDANCVRAARSIEPLSDLDQDGSFID